MSLQGLAIAWRFGDATGGPAESSPMREARGLFKGLLHLASNLGPP